MTRQQLFAFWNPDWRTISLFFCQSVHIVFNNGFAHPSRLVCVNGRHGYFRNYLPSSYERAVSSLCSIRAPAGVAASDIAPPRPNCFCYLAVCAATRPKPSRVFPTSIKPARHVTWYSRFLYLGIKDNCLSFRSLLLYRFSSKQITGFPLSYGYNIISRCFRVGEIMIGTL